MKIMGIPRFFKLPKYNEFNYIPRYYDPEKEARKERLKKINQELGLGDDKDYVPSIKGKFKSYRRSAVKEKRVSNLRLLIIFIFLMLAFYYLLFY
jgi:hypothetical protein